MSYSRAGEEKTQLQKSTFTLVFLQTALDLKLAQSYVINLLSVIGMHIHSMVNLKGFLNRSFIFSHPRPTDGHSWSSTMSEMESDRKI